MRWIDAVKNAVIEEEPPQQPPAEARSTPATSVASNVNPSPPRSTEFASLLKAKVANDAVSRFDAVWNSLSTISPEQRLPPCLSVLQATSATEAHQIIAGCREQLEKLDSEKAAFARDMQAQKTSVDNKLGEISDLDEQIKLLTAKRGQLQAERDSALDRVQDARNAFEAAFNSLRNDIIVKVDRLSAVKG